MSAASSPLAAPFVDGLALGELRYQVCDDCAAAQTLARHACQACGSPALSWRAASGLGTVYALTRVTRAPSADFRAIAPYTLVLVDLDEGPRLMGHADPALAIGARVRAGFFVLADRTLLRFEPAGRGRSET